MTEPVTEPASVWRAPYRATTLAVVVITALVAFDGLAIVAVLPGIAEELGEVALLPWVVTGYLIASSISIIVAGPIIDSIGVQRTFRSSAGGFLLASIVCALAPNLVTLVVARAVQGFFGGIVMAVELASVGVAYPDELRTRVYAATSISWGVLGFGGPAIVAGLLIIGDWRLVFWVNVPIVVAAMVAGWRSLPELHSGDGTRASVDVRGIGLLGAVTVVALLGLGQLGVRPAVGVGAVAATVALAWLYRRHAAAVADPVLRLDHVRRWPLRGIHVVVALVMAGGLSIDNYLPIYAQASRGQSEEVAALTVVFLTIGWSIATVIVARVVERLGDPLLMLAGAVVLLPGFAISGIAVAVGGPLWVVFVGYFVVGLGVGLTATAGVDLLQRHSALAEMGRVNASHQFLRTLGITYGIAVGGAVLLFVVDREVGDVEAVRSALAGDAEGLSAGTAAAIGEGLAWAHVFGAGVALIAVTTAARLWRASRVGVPAPTVAAP